MWVSQFVQQNNFSIKYSLGSIVAGLFSILLVLPGCQTAPSESVSVQEPSAQVQVFPSVPTPIKEEKLPTEEETMKTPSVSPSFSVFKSTQPSFRVAFLVPFSGAHASIGQALWEGAQIAYFGDKNENAIDLLPKDTKGTPQGAEEALTALYQEGGIDFIIGPLLSEEVKTITPLAWQKGVPVLSFSNTSSVAGDNIFILGFSPEEQMRVLLRYAASQRLGQFVLLIPASEYGKRIQRVVHQFFSITPGVNLKEVITYREDGMDISEKIETLRLEGVDALLIPEGGENLLRILAALNRNVTYSSSKLKLIGSGQWDDPSLFSNPLIQGGWFSGTTSLDRILFEKTYEQDYGHLPVRLASLGYDAVKVAIEIAEKGGSIVQTITRPQGFQGAESAFFFTPGGEVQRKWVVYEINQALDGKVRLLPPAS